MTYKTKEELIEAIKDKKIIVKFGAEWCSPCRQIDKTLEEFSKSQNDTEVLKLDVDENGELAQEFGVRSIPALYLFDKGEEVKTNLGVMSLEDLTKWVK